MDSRALVSICTSWAEFGDSGAKTGHEGHRSVGVLLWALDKSSMTPPHLSPAIRSAKVLDRREAAFYEAEEASRRRWKEASDEWAEERADLERRRRHSEERAAIADGKISAVQEEIQATK